MTITMPGSNAPYHITSHYGTGQWDNEIETIAQKMGIPAELLKAMMMKESKGDPNAAGDGGKSFGLMQIQEATWNEFRDKHKDELPPELRNASFDQIKNDPRLNLMAGAAMMKSYHDDWMKKGYTSDEAWKLALRQYNSGSVPDPHDLSVAGPGTPNYVEEIWGNYSKSPGFQPNVVTYDEYDIT